jgi:hypothetical protein
MASVMFDTGTSRQPLARPAAAAPNATHNRPNKIIGSIHSAQNDEYESPIAAIIQEIRRKNGAAAASYFSAGIISSADPWEDMEIAGDGQAINMNSFIEAAASVSNANNGSPVVDLEYCTCSYRRQRAGSGWSSPNRRRFSSRAGVAVEDSNLCTRCGKKLTLASSGASSNTGFAWSSRHSGSFYHMHQDQDVILEEPRHAHALLQSTPQFRFLSSSSTDMQGVGSPNPNLITIIQNAVEGKPKVPMDASYSGLVEYRASVVRDRANHQAAGELASLLWVLAHEMSMEEYGTVENQVFTAIFALVHSTEKEPRMAGLAALDALLAAPSADEERKAIKFANTLSNSLRAAHGDFEFLSAVSKALGHMATRSANVDFVESEVTRALEWLRTERSDRRYVWLLQRFVVVFFSLRARSHNDRFLLYYVANVFAGWPLVCL